MHARRRPDPLAVALAISIALHLAAIPLIRAFPKARAAQPKETPFSITTTAHTPPPTPRPTPTPPPVARPHVTRPQHQALQHVVVAPPHQSAHGTHGQVEPVGPRTTATFVPGDPVEPSAEPGTPQPVETAQPVPPTAPPPACAQLERDARVVSAVTPDRPVLAAQQGAFGSVDVRVTLAADGSVVATAIEHSSGFASLDGAAKDAAAHARYAPALANCAPVGGTYLYRVDFTD